MMTPDKKEVDKLIQDMAKTLKDLLSESDIDNPVIIGIHTGGAWIAEQLHKILECKEPMGTLDISFYRDDFTRIGINPQVRPSSLPGNLDDRHVILVDDVLYTGRTIRAALNEIFDYGRPASVLLACLVDRGGRELPIQANVVGQKLALKPGQQVKLGGPSPLELIIQESS